MENFNAMIDLIKTQMVQGRPSSDLEGIINEKMASFKTHEERARLLSNIHYMWYSKNIDVAVKGGYMDFIRYVEYLIEEENVLKNNERWDSLYNDLNGQYIKDCSLATFREVMDFKRLPNSVVKIIWLTKKTEAIYFQMELGFDLDQFNDCFSWKGGTKFIPKDWHKNLPKKAFFDLINKHKQQ